MQTLLHIDSSARQGSSLESRFGSHTRRLSSRFVQRWRASCPDDPVVYRDVGVSPPSPVTAEWIHAAFTPPEEREPWMAKSLSASDELVDELIGADLIVIGLPMYNFNVPAQFKAYIDNVVRVGRTFGFDRARAGPPYWPLLAAMHKRVVLLSSRGDFGYGEGGRIAHMNHAEPSVRTAFAYIGITDVHGIAIEYDEFSDARLSGSVDGAEAQVDELVDTLLCRASGQRSVPGFG